MDSRQIVLDALTRSQAMLASLIATGKDSEQLVQQLTDNAIALSTLEADMAKTVEPVSWQPIETAPREQEVFIGAFIDGEFKFGRSEQFYEQANVMEGETWSGWVWSVDDCSESIAENPEFWMPLLEAPATTIRGEQL